MYQDVPETTVEINIPTPVIAAHVGIIYLNEINRSLQLALNPHPQDTNHRTAARIAALDQAFQTAQEVFESTKNQYSNSPVVDEYHDLFQQTRREYDSRIARLNTVSPPANVLEWYTLAEDHIFKANVLEYLNDPATIRPESDVERDARTILAEQFYHQFIADPLPPTPSPDTGETILEMDRIADQAAQARRQAIETASNMMAKYDEGLILEISPRLQERSEMIIKAANFPCSPSSVLIGLDIPEEALEEVNRIEHIVHEAELKGEYPDDIPDTKAVERSIYPFVIFAHNGKKIAKLVNEPYPKDYPQAIARAQMNLTLRVLQKDTPLGVPLPTGVTVATSLIRDMLHAIRLSVHDVNPKDLEQLDRRMESLGMTKGARITAFKGMFEWKTSVADMVIDGKLPHWRQHVSKETAMKFVELAKSEGMDDYSIESLTIGLGYKARELGLKRDEPKGPTNNELAMEARVIGIPEPAIIRIVDSI